MPSNCVSLTMSTSAPILRVHFPQAMAAAVMAGNDTF